MIAHTFDTKCGSIHYWTNRIRPARKTLIFLPGLTADHHLFDKQIEYFSPKYNVLTWDAPAHAKSRPFKPGFTLNDKARWLHEILEKEKIRHPVLIGQSMGGYVAQCFLELFPGEAEGFVSIDSAPLKRRYVTAAEIWLLKRTAPMLRLFPWKTLRSLGINGCSRTEYGRDLMRSFLDCYTKEEYCRLSGHGYGMLADAMAADLPYEIDCPAILICGTRDESGSAKSYNRRWARKEGLPLYWIRNAGHNSNTDRPELVNKIIHKFVRNLP